MQQVSSRNVNKESVGDARVNLVWISRDGKSRKRNADSVDAGQRALSPLLHGLAGGLLGALAGCANPGPPRPPSLHLPSTPKDLRAERIGDEVRLTWTTSTDTTDDLPVKLPLRAEICRDLRPAPAMACTVVQRLPVVPGPSIATDTLPSSLQQDPAQLLLYRVRVLNAAGRAADPSIIAFAAAGAAPPSVSDLHASPAAAGTHLLWRPLDFPAAPVSLQRTLLFVPSTPATSPSVNPAVPGKRTAAAQTVRLEGNSAGSDRGGLLDASAQRDATYRYTARRSRSIVLDGKSLNLRSADSPPVTVTVRDITPPAAPMGLAAVADGTTIDLSWEPNGEPDFAGYWVERSPASDASLAPTEETWHRLNRSLLQAPAYRDQPVPSGFFRYRVLAVDSSGNPSPPTATVPVTVRPLSVP